MKTCCYYFGCIGGPGHYLWTAALDRVWTTPCKDWPFGRVGEKLDGGYMPGPAPRRGCAYTDYEYQIQGLARLSHVEGWTVLAIWDRSVDKRPGCNSEFVARGELGRDEMVALAEEYFSAIWKRINDEKPVEFVVDV